MENNTTTSIKINGEDYNRFIDLQLSQSINQHHFFEIGLLWNQFQGNGGDIILKSQELVGQKLELLVKDYIEESEMQECFFEGVITEVEPVKSHQSSVGDHIVVRGYSTSILLDNAPNCACFEERSLSDIINTAAASYTGAMAVQPLVDSTLPYIVQYNQSNFAFLQQLAIRFGEWFYYDGEQLVFGTNETEPIELQYGKDLLDFSLKMEARAKKFNYITHDYIKSEKVEVPFATGSDLPGDYTMMAEKSETLYPTEGAVNYHQHSADGNQKTDLEAAIQKQNNANVADTMVLRACSKNTGLKVGGVISIVHKTVEDETVYGNYIITSLTHSNSEGGEYRNSFEAIPEKAVHPPYTNINMFPRCESQRAVVADNADPEGLGRIKVQFAWQTTAPTPWIRIAQPHGGADKGFHFIPEIGEEVMTGFEGGNAEMPYVIGTLYHSTAKPESMTTETNDIKAIRTRSGHTIELNDTDGEEKINIYDNEGSIITFDTANKSLIINSAENIDISAKNINITAEENIVVGAKANIDIAAEGDMSNQAKGNVTVQSDGDTSINSGGAAAIEASKDATLKGMNLVAEGTQNADLKGGVQTNVTGTMTAVKGAAFAVEVK